MPNRILVPVDLDHADKLTKALDHAGRIAKDQDATVIYADIVDAVPTASPRPIADRVADKLRAFAAMQAAQHEIETEPLVALRGDLHLTVGSDIIKAAKDTDCDLIVMASHVPGLKEHFLSSNAGYVASHAPISVYVVR